MFLQIDSGSAKSSATATKQQMEELKILRDALVANFRWDFDFYLLSSFLFTFNSESRWSCDTVWWRLTTTSWGSPWSSSGRIWLSHSGRWTKQSNIRTFQFGNFDENGRIYISAERQYWKYGMWLNFVKNLRFEWETNSCENMERTQIEFNWILWRNKSDRLHEKGRKRRAKKKQPKVFFVQKQKKKQQKASFVFKKKTKK